MDLVSAIMASIIPVTQGEQRSIHRVTPNIRERDPESYEPRILSIGPYHHGNLKLEAMEGYKRRYLQDLLRRKQQSGSVESLLEGCIEVIRGSKEQARSYYSDPVILDADDFVKMMVFDGCFIVELLVKFYEESEEDPFLNWMGNAIRRDILTLENQIPFFILEKLFEVTVGCGTTTYLPLRELAFFYLTFRRSKPPLTEQEIYHLLHFYDVILLPKSPNTSNDTRPSSVQSILMKRRFTSRSFSLPTDKMSQTTIPCAVKLEKAGIKLRSKPADTFLDVTFEDGTLGIPPVSIHHDTNSIFKNLVALERCRPDLGSHFTWYVTFLDCIVNTPKDVSILQKCGIVDNMLGSKEEVAQLIKLLGKDTTIIRTNHKFLELFTELKQHSPSRWQKYRAILMRDHFNSPWSIISLVAASFLLLMTAAQVVLAVLSYKKQ